MVGSQSDDEDSYKQLLVTYSFARDLALLPCARSEIKVVKGVSAFQASVLGPLPC